ncbi:hypothetical protein F5Y16DRAFT_137691 [Xylariaceae sp. FL0255]|nr:hypothetical protein F5Y16DRAFT_137691 [Xylariaceae sp. FL0255]
MAVIKSVILYLFRWDLGWVCWALPFHRGSFRETVPYMTRPILPHQCPSMPDVVRNPASLRTATCIRLRVPSEMICSSFGLAA